MKLSTPIISFALLASSSSASPLEAGQAKRAADNCLRAVRVTPSIGLPFCSSALTILPVTSTSYVAAPTVTVVKSTTETASTTLTTTTGTETVTTTAGAGQLAKRRTDPTAIILNQRGNDLSRVSSACGEFLVGVATSASTVIATTTPTLLTTAVATETETSTVETVAVTTVTTQPAPSPALTNPGFDADSTSPTGWQINIGLPCNDCTGGVQSNFFRSAPNAFQATISSTTGRVGVSHTLTCK